MQKKEGVNAVFYIIKSGYQWRILPKDFPPYSTVHSFDRRFRIKEV
ncbi:transposase [Holospora elegans]